MGPCWGGGPERGAGGGRVLEEADTETCGVPGTELEEGGKQVPRQGLTGLKGEKAAGVVQVSKWAYPRGEMGENRAESTERESGEGRGGTPSSQVESGATRSSVTGSGVTEGSESGSGAVSVHSGRTTPGPSRGDTGWAGTDAEVGRGSRQGLQKVRPTGRGQEAQENRGCCWGGTRHGQPVPLHEQAPSLGL